MNWWKSLKGRVRLDEPLEGRTTFKIGGPAKLFIEPKDIGDLKFLFKVIKKYRIPLYVIGKGSNILVGDRGVDGVVLRLSAPYFKGLSRRGNRLKVGSGVLLSKVVLFTEKLSLSGAEFLAGIPGTVGGALAMNAGVSEKNKGRNSEFRSISELIDDVTVMDDAGNIKTLRKKDIKFAYRQSSLAKYIILSMHIRLVKGAKGVVRGKIKKYINYRKATQDLLRPSAGCVFKNPKGYSAGRLIDSCGLKNKVIRGACISSKHANFILNLGKGKAKDVLELMALIKRRVKNRFNITLKPEIKIWQ
ncbi:MAG: UDP-N-acetylmuramate dehydrogenase [Candidatus Omnitrophota bacterium]